MELYDLLFLILTACCVSVLPCCLCLDAQYQYCQDSRCGSTVISYPFGVGNRGCGDPGYQIHCVQNSALVITIKRRNYTILGFHSHPPPLPEYIATGDSCQFLDDPFSMQTSSSRDPDTVVNITGKQNMTLTVYKCDKHHGFDDSVMDDSLMGLSKCNATIYLALDETERPIVGCSLIKNVLVVVGLIKWPNDANRDNSRLSCHRSDGICGYNISEPAQPFVCYCEDGPHAHECPGHGSRNQKAIIIGCSIGGVALTAVVVILFLTFYGERRKQPPPPRSSTSKVEKFLREYAYEMPTRYSYSQLKKMTNNFAEKLGEGGFGVVYKGKLRNGALVAVKILDRHRHSQTQFMNEVATIGRVHHVNLVRLLGYCFETHTSALVYEYMVNGSLEKFIFAGKENGQVLRWEQLYSIALGTARGIAYLHQDCEKRIIHFDIKPHNILLDVEFTPKVSDFGLATLCGKGDDHVSMTAARGTPGYVAPEVWSRDLGPVTDRADVYSFGMLLLEIVGGRKNIGLQVSRSSQFYFPEWAFKLLESGELGMRLRGGEMEVEEEEKARRLTKVGLWCIQYIYRDGPCMSRVVQMLEGNGDDVSSPPLPLNSSPEPEKPFLSSSSIESRL